jgi:hypothetical protein
MRDATKADPDFDKKYHRDAFENKYGVPVDNRFGIQYRDMHFQSLWTGWVGALVYVEHHGLLKQ